MAIPSLLRRLTVLFQLLAAVLLVQSPAVPLLGQSVEDAHRLSAQKRFAEAEESYRGVLARDPASRDARLGLARVLLWQLRYREAEVAFRDLVRRSPADAEAREGLATALYWSGDYRRAKREFERLLNVAPSNATALRSLEEIRGASRPGWRMVAGVIDDDQPYTLSRAGAEAFVFSDPLTRWDLVAGAFLFDDPDSGRKGDAPYARLGADIVLGRPRLTFRPEASFLRFPDGESKLLPGLAVGAPVMGGRGAIEIGVRERELLRTATATANHPSVRDLWLTWKLDHAGWLAATSAHQLEYFDGLEGVASDAFLLAPLRRSERMTLQAGISAAWRDTDQSRLVLRSASILPGPSGSYLYHYDAVYDPYYTPQEQIEGRLILAARWHLRSLSVALHADGGRGEEDVLSFGPPSGTSPLPPVQLPVSVSRSYEPWRAALSVTWPLGGGVQLDLRYEHSVTAFYESDDVSATLVGRF